MKTLFLTLNKAVTEYRGKCVYCLRELPSGKDCCEKCRARESVLLRHSFYGNTLFTAEYKGAVRSLIHRYKYSGHPSFSLHIVKLMADTLAAVPVEFDIITFVPIHENKLRERGFDQSELLCLYLAEAVDAPGETLLRRVKNTKPLFSMTKEERTAEVKNAFEFTGGDISGRNILLIDDISTTGASMDECERILGKNGGSVIRFAFARGS